MVEFGAIEPSLKYARAVQRLTLQDVTLGEFPDPLALANPNNLLSVYRQKKKLKAHPDRYEGAFQDAQLLGYMKSAEWSIADELPFANEKAAERLQEFKDEGILLDPARTLGIFGLVVSNKLEYNQQQELFDRFLYDASDKARDLALRSIKIVLHDKDPVLEVARDHGYEFTGRVGVAAGASGLVQRLYRKPLDS